MTAPSVTTLPISSGSWAGLGLEYRLDSSQTVTNSVFYELYDSNGVAQSSAHGIEFRNESGSTVVYCETAGNNSNPFLLKLAGVGSPATSVTISNGTTLEGYKSDNSLVFSIGIISGMLWTSSGGDTSAESASRKVFCNFW